MILTMLIKIFLRYLLSENRTTIKINAMRYEEFFLPTNALNENINQLYYPKRTVIHFYFCTLGNNYVNAHSLDEKDKLLISLSIKTRVTSFYCSLRFRAICFF